MSPWLSGDGSAPLCVVTGSPGAGKSALLGVLVCAAHRSLREPTRPIWGQIVQAPVRINDLAAVHARERVLGAVTASIARQLDLPENLTAAELIDALRTRPTRPVLVVDALDETDDPQRLINELLLPLISEKTRGNPVRLLVGARLYEDYQPLFDCGWMINLDKVEQDVLEDDLLHYVQGLLRTTSEYRKQGGAVGAFAQAVASVLATPDVGGGRLSGPFLVAGLYTRYFMTVNADRVVTDAAAAAQEGAKVPVDLRGVLDLDLRLESDALWLRPVLTALAYARGSGMPVSVLTRVAAAFAPAGTRPTTGQIRSALNVARFYVRQSLAPDRSNVYRLFHQGLVDTLAENSAERLGAVLDALVSSLGPPDQRDWNAAEPYVLEYVREHASAAGRVKEIEADPGFVLHPGSPLRTEAKDAAELALIAVRNGNRALARRAANLPGSPHLMWQPRWSLGTLASDAWSAEVNSAPSRFESIAISGNGESVVALGSDGLVCWEWAPDQPPRLHRTEGYVMGHKVLLSRLGTVFALGDSGTVLDFGDAAVWEQDDLDPVRAAAISGPSEIVYVDHAGEIVRHDLVTLRRDMIGSTGLNSDRWSIADAEGAIVAVAFADSVWLKVFTYPGREYAVRVPQDPISTFAISPDGRHVVAGTEGGWLIFAQLQRYIEWEYFDQLHSEITAVAATSGASRLAAGCEDGTVVVFGPDGRRQVTAQVSHRPIRKLTLCALVKRGLALDDDGKAHWFEFEAGVVTSRLPTLMDVSAGDLVVTAFLAESGEVTVGLNDGTVAAVVLETGELLHETRLAAVARELASVDLGGRDGTLVATGAGYSLLHDHFDRVIDLGLAEWAKEYLSPTDPPPRIGVGSGVVEVWHDGYEVRVRKLGSSPDLGLAEGVDLEWRYRQDSEVLCSAYFGQRPLAFSGGSDGSVDVWDLESLEMVDTLRVGGPVRDVRTVSGRYLLVLAGGELVAFEHYDGSRKGSS
ncbi:NACHT and WD repeat domain-containing protein [Lentzea guizhouensis]|uniref:NACHT and WD repeat domain-containing protein n=1 Tax=Lentzea guizhouensis TaxID=1586287 RepID=UPI0008FF593D